MSETVAKRSEFCVDQRIVIYWPKSYLLVLIYYYCEGRGRPNKNRWWLFITPWIWQGYTKKEKKEGDGKKKKKKKKKGNKKTGKNKIPTVVNPQEIWTGFFSNSITL